MVAVVVTMVVTVVVAVAVVASSDSSVEREGVGQRLLLSTQIVSQGEGGGQQSKEKKLNIGNKTLISVFLITDLLHPGACRCPEHVHCSTENAGSDQRRAFICLAGSGHLASEEGVPLPRHKN